MIHLAISLIALVFSVAVLAYQIWVHERIKNMDKYRKMYWERKRNA